MTIVASVKVRDGLVLGTDSMTQLSTVTGWVKSYANARKLFQLGVLPVGVMTHGLGNVGNRSIEGVVRDFCRTQEVTGSVGDIAKMLFDHVSPLYAAELPNPDPTVHSLGFFLAGYSPGAEFAEEFEFILPADSAPRENAPGTISGAAWRGIFVPFAALAKGMSPGVQAELLAKGTPQDEVNEMSARHGMTVILDGMPVQDAINFATYILDLTIGWATFQIGPPSCARPIQLAVITPDDGWRWIARPELTVP